ncbi:MAG: flagellar hook-basal body complex protein FliE [Bacillota bacterium]|jgi:flagellar hook-basal body complex protein FliE|nr:flagellar hook-basal body complex protein FliE [Clostridia bacterium]
MKLLGVGSEPFPGLLGAGSTEKPSSANNFHALLTNMLDQVKETQRAADDLTVKFIAGSVEDIHQVAFAMEQAQLTLQLAVQVRNKIVEGYQEIMRMQV